jgi:hypothetical protein
MPTAEYERYKKLSSLDRSIYWQKMTPQQREEFNKKVSAVHKAERDANLATANKNYDREAGAALAPAATWIGYNNDKALFDRKIDSYRAAGFYETLFHAVGALYGYSSPQRALVVSENGSPAAKAYRLKLSKELAALWAKSKEKGVLTTAAGKKIEIFKAIKNTWGKG